jgi:hypothetical protein
VLHLETGQTFTEGLRNDVVTRNNRLINYKRVQGVVLVQDDFPLTASMKVIRKTLADKLGRLERAQAVLPV